MRSRFFAGASLIALVAAGPVSASSVTANSATYGLPAIFPGSLATTYTVTTAGAISQNPVSGGGGSDFINSTTANLPVLITVSCSNLCFSFIRYTVTLSSSGTLTATSYNISASAAMGSVSATTISGAAGSFNFKFANANGGAASATFALESVYTVAANPASSVSTTTTVSSFLGSTTFTTNATVRSAIAITPISTMQFGSIAVQSATAGTLTLGANGSLTATGGVDSATYASTAPAAGKFSVKADSGASYVVTLPASLVLTKSAGTQTITATSFTASPVLTSLQGTGLAQTYSLGATLTVPAAAVSGSYVGTFTVTASYN